MPIKNEWFVEEFKEAQGLSLKVKEVLYHQQSKYQDILIFESLSHGTVMVLDDCFMLSDLDEHMYHKALTSYGMQNMILASSSVQSCVTLDPQDPHLRLVNSGPSDLASLALNETEGKKSLVKTDLRVLVIGAGDGGVVRDLFRNWDSQISSVTMVEIDQDVIDVSKKFFPRLASEFDNPKLDLRVEDALAYIKNASDHSFDLVLCDSTDPEGFAAGLIEEDFYRDIKRVLKEDGIFCAQSGSPFFQRDELEKTQKNIAKVFDDTHTYYAPMLTYPGVIWSYTAAGKKIHNKENLDIAEFLPANNSAVLV
jgi:spermidine synthase